jgi:deoxyribonuclease V
MPPTRTCWPTAPRRSPKYLPTGRGEFCRRELPPLRAALGDLNGLGPLAVDGYADLDPSGRPGRGAQAHAEFDIPVIGVAKSRFRAATHAVPALRGSSVRPFYQAIIGNAASLAELTNSLIGPPGAGGSRVANERHAAT